VGAGEAPRGTTISISSTAKQTEGTSPTFPTSMPVRHLGTLPPKRSSKRKSRNEPGWQLRALKRNRFRNHAIALTSIKPAPDLATSQELKKSVGLKRVTTGENGLSNQGLIARILPNTSVFLHQRQINHSTLWTGTSRIKSSLTVHNTRSDPTETRAFKDTFQRIDDTGPAAPDRSGIGRLPAHLPARWGNSGGKWKAEDGNGTD
jgi:hypothetical protein